MVVVAVMLNVTPGVAVELTGAGTTELKELAVAANAGAGTRPTATAVDPAASTRARRAAGKGFRVTMTASAGRLTVASARRLGLAAVVDLGP
jgi:hypothetical protein